MGRQPQRVSRLPAGPLVAGHTNLLLPSLGHVSTRQDPCDCQVVARHQELRGGRLLDWTVHRHLLPCPFRCNLPVGTACRSVWHTTKKLGHLDWGPLDFSRIQCHAQLGLADHRLVLELLDWSQRVLEGLPEAWILRSPRRRLEPHLEWECHPTRPSQGYLLGSLAPEKGCC